MIADELDIGTAEVLGEILVVHQVVGGRLLKDGCQKYRTLVVYMVELGNIVNVVTKLLNTVGRKAFEINLTVDTVQAGRLVQYAFVFGNESFLFKHGMLFFLRSHIQVRFSIHTTGRALSYAPSSSFSRSALRARQHLMVAALCEHPRISAIS